MRSALARDVFRQLQSYNDPHPTNSFRAIFIDRVNMARSLFSSFNLSNGTASAQKDVPIREYGSIMDIPFPAWGDIEGKVFRIDS